MSAWRVLAMLRRVACVGTCHNLSPHQTTRFCCAAALGARVHRSMRKHRGVCNINNLDTKPSFYIHVHRGSSLTSIFSVVFAKIADGRQQITCEEQNATSRTMCVLLPYQVFKAASCFFVIAYVTCYCSLAPSSSLRAASHAARVPLLASWRSLSWNLNCDALLEIIHIIRCKYVMWCQAVLCVFSQQHIRRGHVYI